MEDLIGDIQDLGLEFEINDYRVKLYGIDIEDNLKFGGIKITGKEPKQPDFDLDTGFDKEASKQAANDAVNRFKKDL